VRLSGKRPAPLACLRGACCYPAALHACVSRARALSSAAPQVQVKQNYHAKVELESWLAQLGIFDASKADEELNAKQREHYERLCAQVRQEQRQNEEDTQIYLGRPLRFSTPIQLLHAKSRKVGSCKPLSVMACRAPARVLLTKPFVPDCCSMSRSVWTTRLTQRAATLPSF